MFKKPVYLLLLQALLPGCILAQTGPGGVGSSANNRLWLDANRGVTLSGSSVTNWADQSGNGFNAVPSSTAARPTFVTSSANGYPTFDFDGSDDELWINDNAAFDVTAWHIFLVPMTDLAKDYNAWFCKGNDGQENFELLSYGTNNIHAPLFYTDATRTSPSTADGVVSSTLNVFEYSYSSAVGRDIYRNINNIYTDNENKTPTTNNFSVYIGNERSTTGRFANGDIAEIIMYNAILNSAQRIIVNNYLAAKYNCTLTTNDLYDEDNAANGNYDHDVAGIGRVNSSNIHNDSRGSGIVRILNPTGLDDGEFYFWGHDNGALGYWGNTDFPVGQGVLRRLTRVWRGSETGAITNFEVRFDLTGLGPVTASDLRLLIDTDNDGTFADETTAGGGVIGSAVTLGGNVYGFTNVTAMNNNIRFTLGSINPTTTPLPVELVAFEALQTENYVTLKWNTASEKNAHSFEIERSANGQQFESVLTTRAAGNSKTPVYYSETDFNPLNGLSFYRLKQVDLDGSVAYSDVVAVKRKTSEITLNVFPNPSNGEFKIEYSTEKNKDVLLVVRDLSGKEFFLKAHRLTAEDGKIVIDPGFLLEPGTYIVTASSADEFISEKLFVK